MTVLIMAGTAIITASNVPFRKIFIIEILSSFVSEFESNLSCNSFKSYKNPSQQTPNSVQKVADLLDYF
jgi:hypothetical protein